MTWPIAKLGDHIQVLSGFAFNSKKFSNSEGVPLIRIRDVVRGFTETYYDGEFDDKYLINQGDLLVGMDGQFNAVRWGSGKALLNQRVCKIEALEKLDERYLSHLLPNKLKEIEDRTAFVTVKHLSVKKIEAIEFPLPPIAEQKRIAAILDKADEINNSSISAVNLRNNLIVSTFLEMFGDPVINPKQWEIVSMKDVTEKIGSGATPRGGKGSYVQEGISLIRSMNIHDDRFVAKDLAKITDEQANLLNNVIVNEEDVLLNITGASVCRCAIVPSQILPARVNQHVCILRPKTTIIKSEYLLHCLISTNYKRMLFQLSGGGGATREALTKEQIKHLQIPIPPIEIQNKFARFIQSVNDLTQSVNQKSQSNNNLCNSATQLMNP